MNVTLRAWLWSFDTFDKCLLCKEFNLPWKNKVVSIQFNRQFVLGGEVELRITHNQCHAGIYTTIGTPFLMMHMSVYDIRHWDYDNDCWEVYADE